MSVKSLPITRPKSALDGRRDSCPTCQNLPTTPKLGKKTPLDNDTLINTINYARRRSGAEQWLKRSGVQRSNSSISHRFCFPCLAKYRKPVTDAPIQLKLRYMFSCPPHGKVAFWMTLSLLAVLLWGTLWAILGGDLLPGGNIFSIVVLAIVCTFLGLLLEFMRLPRLLGEHLGNKWYIFTVFILPVWCTANLYIIRSLLSVKLKLGGHVSMNLPIRPTVIILWLV